MPVLFLGLRDGFRNVLHELGLRDGLRDGATWGVVITLPMLVGYAVVSKSVTFNVRT